MEAGQQCRLCGLVTVSWTHGYSAIVRWEVCHDPKKKIQPPNSCKRLDHAQSGHSGTACELYSTNPIQPLTQGSPANEEEGCSAWVAILILLTKYLIAHYLRTVTGSVNNFEFGMSTLFPSESSSVYRRSIEITVPS